MFQLFYKDPLIKKYDKIVDKMFYAILDLLLGKHEVVKTNNTVTVKIPPIDSNDKCSVNCPFCFVIYPPGSAICTQGWMNIDDTPGLECPRH